MEHSDGENATRNAGGGGGGSEDHLSALPDDLLINILLKLCSTTAAARTSVLSRRWRPLWTFLPNLRFSALTDLDCVRSALAAHQAPVLCQLAIGAVDASPDSVAAWLPIAARHLSGGLIFINTPNESEKYAGGRGAFELPCFENATSIWLDLGHLGLAVPPSGVFAQLTNIFLVGVQLHGPCGLGDALSSPRCPSLRTLTIDDAQGLGNFTIHSESLLQMKLKNLHDLQQLTVMSPILKLLIVSCCFHNCKSRSQPVANISAPQLVSLSWMDAYDPSSVQFGEMAHLLYLGTNMFIAYGDDNGIRNSYCTGLLQRFELIHTLYFTLVYPSNITNLQYLMEDITRLPKITFMYLNIVTKGHSFGAGSFHVLRMCTGVRKLAVEFIGAPRHREEQTACSSGCLCDEPQNWKTEELVLDCLQEVEFICLRGSEHEAALMKRLFSWATVLEKMTVTFHPSIPESNAKEFCQMLVSFSRPEICLKGPHFA